MALSADSFVDFYLVIFCAGGTVTTFLPSSAAAEEVLSARSGMPLSILSSSLCAEVFELTPGA